MQKKTLPRTEDAAQQSLSEDSSEPIRIGDMVLHPGDPRVLIGNQAVFLARQELALLEVLAKHEGRVLSTLALGKHLARGSKPLSNDAVAVQVHRLRARLKSADIQIRTLRGFGYLLQAPASPQR
jgi:two-component system, OmpR family, response regulator